MQKQFQFLSWVEAKRGWQAAADGYVRVESRFPAVA
jgi:hypothetical protein